jgi:molybdate transport system ATP-binding protein
MSALAVQIQHRFERLTLDVDLTLGGGLTALLGPSGSGKTSVLNVIAGLLRADRAAVVIDGTVVADSGRGIWVPAHARRIGYVFQDSRLFPHLTVRQNLKFGRWFSKADDLPRAKSRGGDVGLDEIIALLDLAPLLDRHPAKLSGGEKRRVALGRALLSRPTLLLLDEPLGSLDVERRREILPYLDRLITDRRLPMIYVTHDHDEVESRAERVVLMQSGTALTNPGPGHGGPGGLGGHGGFSGKSLV